MYFQIIILAGGKGTRISSIIGETPKVLASINEKPFLDWILLWINSWDIKTNKTILISTCIGHQKIEKFCKDKNYPVKCIEEEFPLGTFGAIANVATRHKSQYYLVINGDTIFKANFKEISKKFISNKKKLPLILLKQNFNNEIVGGYKKIENKWIYTNKKTDYISLGAFFISYKELKNRWIKSTELPFKNKIINDGKREELMIDKDCFGKYPISAKTLSDDIPFIDIGIPKDFEIAQKYIPNILMNI